jgi:hypothetical protein
MARNGTKKDFQLNTTNNRPHTLLFLQAMLQATPFQLAVMNGLVKQFAPLAPLPPGAVSQYIQGFDLPPDAGLVIEKVIKDTQLVQYFDIIADRRAGYQKRKDKKI